jgi:hypothetical protein
MRVVVRIHIYNPQTSEAHRACLEYAAQVPQLENGTRTCPPRCCCTDALSLLAPLEVRMMLMPETDPADVYSED